MKLQKTDLFPNEVYGTKPQPATAMPAIEPAQAQVPAPSPAVALPAVVPQPIMVGGLTAQQLGIAAAFLVGVFALMVMALMLFGGK